MIFQHTFLIFLVTLLWIVSSTSVSSDEFRQLIFHKKEVATVDFTTSKLKTIQLMDIEQYDRQYWSALSEDSNFTQREGDRLMAETALNLLQLKFSDLIETEILNILHTSGLNDERTTAIQKLIETAGGDRLVPIYELSQEEIMQDKYGFARVFKLYLKPDTNPNRAIEILQSSPSVESVSPVGIQKIFR
jgi:hypothetical protein